MFSGSELWKFLPQTNFEPAFIWQRIVDQQWSSSLLIQEDILLSRKWPLSPFGKVSTLFLIHAALATYKPRVVFTFRYLSQLYYS